MKKLSTLFLLIVLAAACKKTDTLGGSNNLQAGKVAPDGFKYSTTKNVYIDFTLLNSDNSALKKVPLTICGYLNNQIGDTIAKGITNDNGKFYITLTIPSFMDTLIIDPQIMGVIRKAKAYIVNGSITCTLGGSTGLAGNIAPGAYFAPTKAPRPAYATFGATSTVISAVGTVSSLGVPTYLLSPNDTVSQQFLADVNYTVPEGVSIIKHNYALLHGTYSNDVSIVQESDVFLTFVTETTACKNTLGYFVYSTANPPTSKAAIDSIHIIFPNWKLVGDYGGLVPGNKIKLGHFYPGQSIGFMIFANAWSSGATFNTNAVQYYTNPAFNPETVDSLKKHTVLFQYSNLFVTSFEDGNRQGGCDNDFNDVVFYTSTENTANAINTSSVAPINVPIDTDGDGVTDLYDAYPTDPTRAYNTYYPSQTQYGTYAYEDNWPSRGDYDMNDLVVSYRYLMVSNAQNQIVEMYADFAPIAVGAAYNNGFGIQLPISSATVKTATGQKLFTGSISLNANGTEAGQTNAVLIPFDNAKQLIKNSDNYVFINTDPTHSYITGDTSHMYIQFTSALTTSQLSISSFNPFAISNGRRGYEIHLPGFAPTNLANTSLFGTGDDVSNPSKGIYYVSSQNYPFGLNFTTSFSYPKEGVAINLAYLHFFDWAGSSGSTYTDWYTNTGSGYRNTSNIYSH